MLYQVKCFYHCSLDWSLLVNGEYFTRLDVTNKTTAAAIENAVKSYIFGIPAKITTINKLHFYDFVNGINDIESRDNKTESLENELNKTPVAKRLALLIVSMEHTKLLQPRTRL